jgi:hypothetical protein
LEFERSNPRRISKGADIYNNTHFPMSWNQGCKDLTSVDTQCVLYKVCQFFSSALHVIHLARFRRQFTPIHLPCMLNLSTSLRVKTICICVGFGI